MRRDVLLRWLERGLLAIGGVLAVWCAVVLIEARYTNNLPVPSAKPAPSLPGDTGSPAPTPSRGAWLARIEAPSVDMSATVLEGTDDGTLSRGAGHIEETPIPGQPGNVGIAGHRDTVFRPLRHIHVGDALNVTTSDHVYRYRVARTSIVGPDDVYVLDPTREPTLTLVTCYPFEFVGHAPRRFIVQARLASEEARAPGAGEAGLAG